MANNSNVLKVPKSAIQNPSADIGNLITVSVLDQLHTLTTSQAIAGLDTALGGSDNWRAGSTVQAVATISYVDPVFTLRSTSNPAVGQTLASVVVTMTFSDPGFPNNGRVIVISGTNNTTAAASLTVSDTGGTPLARLTAGQLSGTLANLTWSAGVANDIVLTSGGSIAVSLTVTDSAGNTDTAVI